MRRAVLACAVLLAIAGDARAANGPPAWFGYDRPAAYGSIATAVNVTMRDHTVLGCGLRLPAGSDGALAPGRFPSIIDNNTPYTPATLSTDGYYATRGYATITCNPRGTQSSALATPATTGQYPALGAEEQRDWFDLVEWMAVQPWSDGRVGMTGFSYGGIAAYHAAAQRPPHLRAIIAGAAYADAYRDISYLGGIRALDTQAWAIAVSTNPLTEVAFREHPLYDEFWKARSIETKWGALRAGGIPILNYGGWYDIYQDGEPRNYRALKSQTWLVMSGGGHLNGADSVPDGGKLAWFDHWLKELPGAPLPATRVLSFEKPDATGRGWQALEDWPPPNAGVRRLHLTTAATLADDAGPSGAREFAVNPLDGQAKYWSLPRPDDAGQDQQLADRVRQTYDSAPLRDDLVLAGPVDVHLRATLSATDGNLVVRVMDVAPDGTSTLISTGWLKASHRASHERVTPVPPGVVQDYDVGVWPTNWRLARGHVLRLSVSSGDVPRIEPDAPVGTISIATGDRGSYADVTVAPDAYDARATATPPAACVSKRRFTIRLRERLRSARVTVDGRPARVLRGRRLRAVIDLRGLPAKTVRVRIVARSTSGRRIVSVRRYRTCVA